MDGRYGKHPFVNDQDDPEYSPANSEDSPRAAMVCPSNSPKRRRATKKKVVSVPIRDVEGSRLKGETPPPSDSWTWRKYGQKPIKGSPYPRGYYRCSSSKGCPARKQVERSRVDPTMLVVTYSCEHNHPWPASKHNSHSNGKNNIHIPEKVANHDPTAKTVAAADITAVPTSPISNSDDEISAFENQFASMAGESLISQYEFKWFSDVESTSSTLLGNPIISGGEDSCSGSGSGNDAMIFPMGEEDESLFADLGELPECSVVFRRGILGERRQCNVAPWCGTNG